MAAALQNVMLFVNTNIGGSRLVLRYPPTLRSEVRARVGKRHFSLVSHSLHVQVTQETALHFKVGMKLVCVRFDHSNMLELAARVEHDSQRRRGDNLGESRRNAQRQFSWVYPCQ